jgi:hypothetical protein
MLQKNKMPDFFVIKSFWPVSFYSQDNEKENKDFPSQLQIKKEGGAEKDITAEIKEEFAQYNSDRVKKYLEYNDIDQIVKKKNIKSAEEFFKKEHLDSKTFLTGLQKEILQQTGKKKFTPAAMQMSDFELMEAFKEGDSIFLK